MKNPDEPYRIDLDGDGLNDDLAPALVAAARDLVVVPSTFQQPFLVDGEHGQKIIRRITECVRCLEDNVIVHPDTISERVGHLTRFHGYRMDGHQYDNDNHQVA